MPTVHFTDNLKRHIACPTKQVSASSVREALNVVFANNPQLRGYVLDDQDRLRRNMLVAIDGNIILDRINLSDPVSSRSEIFVMQALSGG